MIYIMKSTKYNIFLITRKYLVNQNSWPEIEHCKAFLSRALCLCFYIANAGSSGFHIYLYRNALSLVYLKFFKCIYSYIQRLLPCKAYSS